MRNLLALLALPLAAVVAEAQELTVDPGMSRAQVEAQLGKALSARQVGSFVYLFYANGNEARHGMHDLVILQDDKVVDAIFRSPRRRYSGASSSPTGVKAEPTLGPIQVAPPSGAPARQGGVISAPPDTTAAARPVTPVGPPAMTRPVTTPPTAADTARGGNAAKPTTGPGGVPLNPRDSITLSQPPQERGAAVPTTTKQPSQPVPYAGSKPNPTDSAARAKAARDTTKKP